MRILIAFLLVTGCGQPSSDGDAGVVDAGAMQSATADAGKPAPNASLPAWLANRPLNEWFEIPGTVHAGSDAAPGENPADIFAGSNRRLSFCGAAMKGTELVLAAAGGHGDYSGNQVTSIDIGVDAPRWKLRHAATPTHQRKVDVAYYDDGLPSARHTYWSQHWVPSANRILLFGNQFSWGSAVSFPTVDGFDLENNKWDPAGTWPNGGGASVIDPDGVPWGAGTSGVSRWDITTRRSVVTSSQSGLIFPPISYDARRGQLFGLAFGDGVCCGVRVASAARVSNDGKTIVPIQIRPGAAWTQFAADQPELAGMDYDLVNDGFYFYSGNAGEEGRVYVVTPSDGTTWDLAILQQGPGSVTPKTVSGAGVMNRFRYVKALRGFVLMARGTENLYFLRTAE